MTRKFSWRIGAPVLLAFIVLNAYVAIHSLKQIREAAVLRQEASLLQTDISNLLIDLDDMETGQRGYLLTGDTSYLTPYTDAKSRLASHFASMRSKLEGKGPEEQALEKKLESLASSQSAGIEQTIDLRRRGYRKRAFDMIDSGQGKGYMDQSRTILATLATSGSSSLAALDEQLDSTLRKASAQALIMNGVLLALTVLLLGIMGSYARRLESEVAGGTHLLIRTRSQMEELTTAISRDLRNLLNSVRRHAGTLLDSYGGFLPRRGQELAEAISHTTTQMDDLIEDLLEPDHLKTENIAEPNTRSNAA